MALCARVPVDAHRKRRTWETSTRLPTRPLVVPQACFHNRVDTGALAHERRMPLASLTHTLEVIKPTTTNTLTGTRLGTLHVGNGEGLTNLRLIGAVTSPTYMSKQID